MQKKSNEKEKSKEEREKIRELTIDGISTKTRPKIYLAPWIADSLTSFSS